MALIIDRRPNGRHKSSTNREKFLKRVKGKISDTINDIVKNKKIKDINNGNTEVKIKKKDISEPTFGKDFSSGEHHVVRPGNKEFQQGDKIDKPSSGQGKGKGRNASKDGEGEDEFVFSINRDEFLDILFEGLELPNLLKTSMKDVVEWKNRRAGFSSKGVPANLNIIRSMEKSIGRRLAMKSPINAEINEIEDQLEKITDDAQRQELLLKLEELRHRLEHVPFIDDYDLRYNAFAKDPVPITSAAMFCIMDISGSMGEHEKDLAKRFFYLLYLFLTRKYKKVELVFISHTTSANEVTEEEFFHSRENGGTVVSTALELMSKILKERYSGGEWNVYGAQASDGDNWRDDTAVAIKLLVDEILPATRYFTYIETEHKADDAFFGSNTSDLWNAYENISDEKFIMRKVGQVDDIYPVFRQIFSTSDTDQS